MPRIDASFEEARPHPLDVIEQMVNNNDWIFDRTNEQEMAVQVPGSWCDYSLYFAWHEVVDSLLFTCAFDMRVPPSRLTYVHELLALINEKMWIGHFSLWDCEGQPLFRHALPLRGVIGPSVEQMEDLVDAAILECERYYPAFQYVVWAGKTATEAVEAALIETVGEA